MKSILSKLWLGSIMLVITVLGIVWLFQVIFLNKFYTNERVNKLVDGTNEIIKSLENVQLNNIENSTIKEDIVYFSQQYNANFDIIDNKKNSLYVSGNMGGRGMFMQHIDLSEILGGQTLISQTTHPRFGMPIISIGIPIKKDNSVIGAVIINAPTTSIKEATSVLQKQLSVITIISLIIATMISFFLSKIFTKPILAVDNAARRIAEGDYSTKVDIKSKDEIGELGQKINDLSDQLSKIDIFRKEFIANVSHEFKTPLGLIRGYTELVEDNLTKEELEKNKKSLDIIIDETLRLDKIVKDMLMLSQMEVGFTKLDISEFDVKEIVDEVVEKLLIISSKHEIRIDLVEKYSPAIVKGDRDKIKQILMNLIDNAIQHSNDNKNIEISIQSINNKIKVSIRDYGGGISKEDLPYVWDRFYKVDKSRKREDSGTGLGMAIVKNILMLHEAEYGIESEEGKGTQVWFKLNKDKYK